MSVLVRCPGCSVEVRVGRERLGCRARCTRCGLVFQLAAPVDKRDGGDEPEAPGAGGEPLELPDDEPEPRPAPRRPADRGRGRHEEPVRYRAPLLAAAVAVAFLCLGGCGVGGYFAARAVVRAARAPNEPAGATGGRLAGPEPGEPQLPVRRPDAAVIELDGPLGGMHTSGGRLLVFHTTTPNRLAVYDAATRTRLSAIDLHDQNVQVAVGRDKVFVGRWVDGQITRYDLRTGAQEATSRPDAPERITMLAAPANGDGPLVSGAGRPDFQFQARLHDPETLASLDVPIEGTGRHDDHARFPFAQPVGAAHVAVSASGRGISLSGRYYTRTATGYKSVPVNPSSGLRPSPDGTVLLGNSLWTEDGRVLKFNDRTARSLFPAAAGPFFLSLEYGPARAPKLLLHADQSVAPLGELPLPPTFEAWIRRDATRAAVSAHRSVAFLPEPGLVVLAPVNGTEAQLVPVDLPDMLAKAGRELAFTSVPPATVPRGREYEYIATAITRTGVRPRFELDRGPPGMTVSPAGRLVWNPDASSDRSTADVRLVARSADGAMVAQEFRLFFGLK